MSKWEKNCNETWVGNLHSWQYSFRPKWLLLALLLKPPYERVCDKCGKSEYRYDMPDPSL